MTRALNKLSARFVATVSEAGRYGDGGGLYLSVSANGGRRWTFMFRWATKLTEMGLGSARDVPLARAREKATAARALLAEGQNPLAVKRAEPAPEAVKQTFGAFADALVADLNEGFRNEKHRQQWTNTLATYGAPLRPKGLDEITTEDVLGVLQPIWLEKSETASRVRGRIERVLDAAKARGLRTGENPARWRGHLDHLMPARRKLQRGHHAAMPFPEVPSFIAELRGRPAVAAMALEYLILCASRTGEVLGATWGEVDLLAKVWTIPAARMKAGVEHRVPLTPRAIEILESVRLISTGDHIFPGQKPGQGLSDMGLTMLLRRMKREAVTSHGFRSSFRDWAGEVTNFPREVAEAALAHAVGDKVELAYRRGDALEKRRQLMAAWADFLESAETSSVLRFPAVA